MLALALALVQEMASSSDRKSFSATQQALAMIRLNSKRFIRNPMKWLVLAILIFTILPYALFKILQENLPASIPPPDFSIPISKFPVFVDKSKLTGIPNVDLLLANFTDSTKNDFRRLNSSRAGVFVEFTDITPEKPRYTLAVSSKNRENSLNELWLCASVMYCPFGPVDMRFLAGLKYRIDAAIAGTIETPLLIKQRVDIPVGTMRIDNWQNFFFLGIGYFVCQSFIEDKKKVCLD
jgi:hypothetical protein